MFTSDDYDRIHSLVFRPDYSGYKPTVTEIPNGDGKADSEKRYAHVALKYFTTDQQRSDLMPYLQKAHDLAMEAAYALDMPFAYMPDLRYGALRILDYPPGAISNRHEDFDLFTLMCFRDQPDRFASYEASDDYCDVQKRDLGAKLWALRQFNQQAHMGQLGAAIDLGPATPHEVLPSETRQRSIVYFAIPDHDAILPNPSLRVGAGPTVREWLNARMARSRTAFKAYE